MSFDISAARAGDVITAGAGMTAELITELTDNAETAVVRWLHWSPSIGWWGADHSRVPWRTVCAYRGPADRPTRIEHK